MKLDAKKRRKNSHNSMAFIIKFQITVKSFLQMLINKLFFCHIKGPWSMTHSKCSVKESSHTFRICRTVCNTGKEGVRDEAFAEVVIHLKLLCVLGSENFINGVSENRAHQRICLGELPDLGY